MIKKEINEIKSQYTLEECGILRLCGCYVNGDKEKVARFNQTFLNLPEEEKHKYFDIFRKTLSGTPGKNLLDMRFTMDSYADGGARTFLYQLRDSELKDDALLEKFYDKVIESYSHPGNYLILLINQVYDVPDGPVTALTWKMHQMRCTAICCAVSVMYRFQNRDWDILKKIMPFMTSSKIIWWICQISDFYFRHLITGVKTGKACYIIQRMPMRLNSCFWHRF